MVLKFKSVSKPACFLIFIILTFGCEWNEINPSFLVTVRYVTKTSAQLVWTPPGNLHAESVRYEVFLNDVSIARDLMGSTYILSALTRGSEYEGKVVGVDHEGNSISASFSFKTEDIKVFVGDVWLKYQTDVNAFAAEGYDRIDGNLRIGGICTSDVNCFRSTVVDLTPLNTITRIESDLIIYETPYELTTLDGLQNLTYIGGLRLDVTHFDLDKLNCLDSIDRDVFIMRSGSISRGLEGLRYVKGSLYIGYCHQLTDLRVLQNLVDVGSLIIDNNNSLNSLNGLNNLARLRADLMITNNRTLTDFCALVPLITNGGLAGTASIISNPFNPTTSDIVTNNCKN